MKIKRLLSICGVTAAILFTAGSLFAQNDNGGGTGGGQGNGNGGGGQRRNRGGQQGGGGFGNFDPAQMQQRMMQRYQDELGVTNDTDWSAIQPLVQKVMDARIAVGFGGRGFGRGGRGGQGGQGGQAGAANNPFNQPNPDRDALQKAIDDSAPSSQIKDLLAKYEASQKAKQSKLVAAQKDLRAVLTVKQEASATLAGLLD